jgi:DNA-binding beta-propeller fold protein YncE
MHIFAKSLIAATAGLAALSPAHATRVFFTNDGGNIQQLETSTNAVTSITNLSNSFGINQVIGLAFDAATNTIYAFDRFPGKVYAVNAGTGSASLALDVNRVFQGGAFKGGSLFGIDENAQQLGSYTLGGVESGFGGDNIDHTHGLGINAASGQLYAARGSNIFEISDSGILGNLAFSTGQFMEDVDYFGGNFLYVAFDSNIYSTAGGILYSGTGQLSGIAVDQGFTSNVPEPAAWAMMIIGFGLIGGATRRRTKVSISFA